jgi:hypothetical protein
MDGTTSTEGVPTSTSGGDAVINKHPRALNAHVDDDDDRNQPPASRYAPQKRKHDPRKATIHCNVWKTDYWTYHQEEKVKFKKLDQARDWAKKHGYDGIWIQLH